MAKAQYNHRAAVQWARQLWAQHNPPDRALPNFIEFAYEVAQIVKLLDPSVVPITHVAALKDLQDDYDKHVAADPMMLYEPAHAVALSFHKSKAKIRYNRSANRTSKTQTGYAEHYLAVTKDQRWRRYYHPAATFIVGVDFTKYATNVFEKKFITGESGNLLSPMFPEGGKWLHHYDPRKHCVTLACEECANAGKAKKCPHPKSTITLYSDESGPMVLQGAAYALGHFDEHISEEFFTEGMERLKTVPHSALIVTGTPILGRASWEYRILEHHAAIGSKYPGTDDLYVEVFTIDQVSGGLVSEAEIEASKLSMDPLEQEARIYGRPAPLAKHGVFDAWAMQEMEARARVPEVYSLHGDYKTGTAKLAPDPSGRLHVWELPVPGQSYCVGADIAAGIVKGDYSCASVFHFPSFRMVAQLHGHMNPIDYARQLALLGKCYNNALLVPERTGMGVGTITALKEMMYFNLFRDLSDPSAAGFGLDPVFGVDTNSRTKSYMIAGLQKVVKERQVDIPCLLTIMEMRSFGQEKTDKGNVSFKGEGSHDDRVMSAVFAVYVMLTYPLAVNPNYTSPPPPANPNADADLRRTEFWSQAHKELAERGKTDVNSYFGE